MHSPARILRQLLVEILLGDILMDSQRLEGIYLDCLLVDVAGDCLKLFDS